MITTAPGEEGQVDYGDGPMVRHPQTGKYRRTRLFVLTLGYSPQSGAAAGLAVERADLGRAARARVSPAGRRPCASSSSTTLQRGRAHAGHLRPDAQSALSRRARALRRRRAAVSRRRSRSQGQSRSRRRPRAEDAAARAALRDARGGAGLSRSLGSALGRHAHPRHDEAPGRRDVCRGAARARPAAARAVSLLPASACARCISTAASRSRPPTTARRPAGSAGASPCSGTTSTSACSIRTTGQLLREHRARSRAAGTASTTRIARAARRRPRSRCWRADARRRRTSARSASHPSARRASGRPPHPRRARARQEARRRRRRGRLRRRPGTRRPRLPLRPPLSRAPARRCRSRCARSIRSSVQLTHYRDLIDRKDQEDPHESRRTPTRPAPTAALRHGRRARNAAAASPGRNDGAHRSSSPPSSRTNSSAVRTGCSSAAASRPRFRDPARRSTPSTSTSTRR